MTTSRETVIATIDRILDGADRSLVTVLVTDPRESLLEFTDRWDAAVEKGGTIVVVEYDPVAVLVRSGSSDISCTTYRDPKDIVEISDLGVSFRLNELCI
ncbi:hypothetical protein V1T76_15355 [Roseibium sp. FZY0029]|uniref:hypothetical protein n=1 Tax=Roseibium sp. FZY0029 TaxID=3116647 RepID=UPI002EA4490C|nr:hypothetical protein [Roseibium sp. FZY0029]